jgi:5-formyltetrahydrofolate cyclo-ligase
LIRDQIFLSKKPSLCTINALMTKSQQRLEIRARLAKMTAGDRAAASTEACLRVLGLPAYAAARSLLFFSSLSDEPDTAPLVAQAWQDGKRVFFPRVRPDGAFLEIRAVTERGHLRPGAFGIPEPDPARCPEESPTKIDFALVPGLAFDRSGHRLGRGRGYYDRLLAELPPACFRAGFFFACQELPAVPREPHDQRLHAVVTEREMIPVF